jgi:hypothetical protein
MKGEGMKRYLLIESRCALEVPESTLSYDLAARLARAGHPVTLFLVQNGVFAARPGAKGNALTHAAAAGVEVLADEFALRERGIRQERLAAPVRSAPLDMLVDRLAAGCTAIWH